MLEEVEGVEEGISIGDEVVALRVAFRLGRFLREDEGNYYRASLLASHCLPTVWNQHKSTYNSLPHLGEQSSIKPCIVLSRKGYLASVTILSQSSVPCRFSSSGRRPCWIYSMRRDLTPRIALRTSSWWCLGAQWGESFAVLLKRKFRRCDGVKLMPDRKYFRVPEWWIAG